MNSCSLNVAVWMGIDGIDYVSIIINHLFDISAGFHLYPHPLDVFYPPEGPNTTDAEQGSGKEGRERGGLWH